MNPMESVHFSDAPVWTAGELELPAFQVHGLVVTPAGTVLAYTEGRIKPDDDSPHHILLKRSTDRARCWGENQVIAASAAGECWAQPIAVVDRTRGRIVLFYCLNMNNHRTRVFQRTSDDDGVSWSSPVEMTGLFSANHCGWTLHMPGPGHGIQLRDGRMLVHLWHRRVLEKEDGTPVPPEERMYGASVIASDDGGCSWQWLAVVPYVREMMNHEARLVEMENGLIRIYMRSSGENGMRRSISESADGGGSWSAPQFDTALPGYVPVDTGFVRHSFPGDGHSGCILMSHPDSTLERTNMTIRASFDEGRSWGAKRLVSTDRTSYSDLAVLPDGTVLCLYGKGRTPTPTHWNDFHPVSVSCARLFLDGPAS